MPFALTSDTDGEDPMWEVLAGGRSALIDRLQSAYWRLLSYASHQKTDGYLPEQATVRLCWGSRKTLELLTTPALDRPPWVHRRGDECSCLGDAWIDGYDYRIHKFLRRNPSKVEYERNQAQKADLRNAALKALVYARDGGCCRYCRSGPLSAKAGRSRDRRKVLTYDHVDPDSAAGADGAGLVVACDRCNTWKGARTPDEADMVLLPPPTEAEAAAWKARGLALFDRPTMPVDHRPITDETATEQRTDHCSDQQPTSDRDGVPIGDPDADCTGEVRPEQGEQRTEQAGGCSPKGDGLGRGRGPGVPGPDPPRRFPAQPARTADAPDIYHRRSRPPPARDPPADPPRSAPTTPPEPSGDDDDRAHP